MTAASTRLNAVTAPVGRLLGLLVAAAFLLAALTGNSFAVHVGMTSMSAATVVGADTTPHAVAGAPADRHDVRAASADPAVLSAGSDLQHLMHLVGACLAVLAGAVLLLLLPRWGRDPADGYLSDTTPTRLFTPALRRSWSPPPPSPPTSSPVIRT